MLDGEWFNPWGQAWNFTWRCVAVQDTPCHTALKLRLGHFKSFLSCSYITWSYCYLYPLHKGTYATHASAVDDSSFSISPDSLFRRFVVSHLTTKLPLIADLARLLRWNVCHVKSFHPNFLTTWPWATANPEFTQYQRQENLAVTLTKFTN